MATIVSWLNVNEKSVVPALQEAGKKLDGAGGEVLLDFVSVQRVDSNALRAMDSFVRMADEKAVKVVLRGLNVDVYKVLKLVKLAPRFSYVSVNGDSRAAEREEHDAQ